MKQLHVLLVHLGRHFSKLPVTPPIGVLSLAAWARTHVTGVRVSLIDQRIEHFDHEETMRRIVAMRPDVVGLSYMTDASSAIPEATKSIRQALPECTILLGGAHPSAVGGAALEGTSADIAVEGEGEIVFENILRALQEGGGFDEIPGIFRRLPDGGVTRNPGAAPLIANLDDVPFLAYDLLDLPRYWSATSVSPTPPPRKYAVLFTSRGCPYRCIFCHHIFGKEFRAQSPARIVAEMDYLESQYGVLEFDFFDDIFNLDRQRACQFAEEVCRRGRRRLSMVNGLRTDILTQEVVDALTDAGMYACACALDSGSERIQKLIRKNLNVDRFLHAVEMLTRRRVFTYGFTILGFPTETGEEIQMTVDTVVRSRLHMAHFFKATPYPNTELYDLVVKMLPEKIPALDFANHDIQYSPVVNLSAVSDDELLARIRKATRTFYGNPVRMYRILRDFPHPLRLVRYVPGAFRQAFSHTRGRYRAHTE